ncbi:GEVED domain-containing protein [Xanthovirga aplysinae]|uniref:GEVED domain-containing protein n=1 Tax=Xanthovirga aplysinae TaxID=2529853 RepID=UPI0012BC2D1A|nr:GEVED domain-containing protein [Xanthovirga aplysinae]MTI29811.1 T9SS type A sorting domain-containing protein [Xanthovirga aplysinae]
MKTKQTLKLLFIICMMLVPALFLQIKAQISAGGVPFSFQQAVQETNIPMEVLPSINLTQLQQEDQQDNASGLPPRFGYPHEVNFRLDNTGFWQDVEGGRLWRLDIQAPGALSVNVLYEKFWLPEGASLFIYNKSKSQVIGAFTSQNNKGTKENPKKFATGLVYGNTVTLEYFEPENVSGEGVIEISRVIHGYRYIDILGSLKTAESFGDSGNCQVNVNCSEGNNWQDEKTGVAMILVNGNRYCTGSLVNNTSGDFTPYFLTADHCLGGWANSVKHDAISAPDLSHWSFYWNYESPGCSDGSDFVPPSTSGANVVANNGNTDFALLLLDENPVDLGIDPYFNGWDRSDSPGSGGVGIHHPSGDIKKIATHNIIPNPSTNIGLPNPGNYWQIQWSQTSNGWSVTEGGSSGSPLFNSNGHVIGQLYGGSSINCSDPANDPGVYGKVFVSWDLDPSENRRQLESWLDPDNTGSMTLDGSYPTGTPPPPPPPPPYCETGGDDRRYEWINSVEIGDLVDNHNDDSAGYFDKTSDVASLAQGGTASVALSPAFSGSTYPEVFRIWIDYNQDRDFEDSGELVFDGTSTGGNTLVGSFTVPSSASTGDTRIRVSMQWRTAPESCGTFQYGQTIDYTANISSSSEATASRSSMQDDDDQGLLGNVGFSAFPIPTIKKQINILSSIEGINQANVKLYNSAGMLVYQKELSFEKGEKRLLNFSSYPNGLYHLLIEGEGKVKSFKVILQ